MERFWAWLDNGCEPVNDNLDKQIATAATSDEEHTLSVAASHPCPWVRLAVASNPATPPWVLWGEGVENFGLADDDELWVRAVVLLAHPRPPESLVELMVGP